MTLPAPAAPPPLSPCAVALSSRWAVARRRVRFQRSRKLADAAAAVLPVLRRFDGPCSARRRTSCCSAMETECEGNGEDPKEKDEYGGDINSTSADATIQDNVHTNGNSQTDIQNKHSEAETAQPLEIGDPEISNVDTVTENDLLDVASGSPLPGMKQLLSENVTIPKATIDVLKDQVFGFDTFFVTSFEPYEGGVLFKGNLRGKAAKSYEKISKRLQDKFNDQYKLFILINPDNEKPVAVVIPRQTLEPVTTAVPEWFAAAAFGLVTIFTLLLRNVPALQSNLLSTFDNLELLKDGLPGALVTAIVLGSHELAHFLVAGNSGIKLGVPYFVPSWQIGSFGAITRIVNIVSNREDLLKLAAAGPLAGFSIGLLLLLLGFIVPPFDGLGIVVDSSVFHESLLVGSLAKFILGDALKDGAPLSLNPLILWAWAGLLINAINSIPAGEIDGGRIAFALWGRKVATRLSSFTLVILGISALFNDVSFYWVVLILFLQRGPIAPCSEEITDPDSKYAGIGVLVLLLGLLICLPYPLPFDLSSLNLSSLDAIDF